MKKIDEKGFVLAEAVIVSVFVLGMFTLLITNVLPSVSKYNNVLKYDNPEDIYKVDTLMKTINISTEGYYGTESNKLNNICDVSDFCEEMLGKDFLNIEEVLLMKKTNFNCNSNELKRGMKEYCGYFKKQYFSDGESGQSAVLVKFGNGNYAGLWR